MKSHYADLDCVFIMSLHGFEPETCLLFRHTPYMDLNILFK